MRMNTRSASTPVTAAPARAGSVDYVSGRTRLYGIVGHPIAQARSPQTVTFDSTSTSMDDRKKTVILTLQAGNYDPKKDYFLVVRDVNSKVELHRQAVKIDLALANDF